MNSTIRVAILITLLLRPSAADDVPTDERGPVRSNQGLLLLYDFSSASGNVVRDRSGAGFPIDLKIEELSSVSREAGSLSVQGKTLIRTDRLPKRLVSAIKRTGELTIETWLKPAKTDQDGPARIVTLSRNGTNRDFTLGQDGDKFDVRFRTTGTSSNGLPSLSSKPGSLTTELTHVVYTRDRAGTAQIYLDGELNNERDVNGSTSAWETFRFGLANEQDKSRQWRGTYYLVALYDRHLSPREIQQNFQAGAYAETPALEAFEEVDPRIAHFETNIAPLLANHCLECHDAATKKGKLDLAHKITALKGGESGAAIVAGNSAESLVWESVESDEMPQDRPPLSTAEKALLKQWIDDGATWSLDVIDPAVYVHGGGDGENWLRRLTVPEYIATVQAAVGVDVEQEARELLPRDVRADGFSNTAYNLNTGLKHVDAYSKLAEIIVARMDVREFAERFSQTRRFTDDDMGDLISKMGKWLLRGPLDEHELISYRGISTTVASASGSFDEAVGLIIEGMLQSPRFIYRVENQRGDGSKLPVSEYELASRLSYIVWGGPPDEELISAAEKGDLFENELLKSQLTRMLGDPRAQTHSTQFVSEWLNLGRLDNMKPNFKRFPNWNPQLAQDMRKETLAFFQEVVWTQQRPLADLLNAQVTFATPDLAKHYGLPLKDFDPAKLARYDLTSVPGRGGLISQGSVLTVGGDEASMVTRGLLVMHELLRGVVKDPPACVDTTPVPTKAGLPQRAIAMERIANETCGGCHSKFEPLAFGLEKFDGLGAYHENDEHGNRLRDDGQILFPGTAKAVEYNTSAELMDLLAQSDRVKESITWKLAQFALGRPLGANDASSVAEIHAAAQEGGGTYVSTITAIALSDLVQSVRTEE